MSSIIIVIGVTESVASASIQLQATIMPPPMKVPRPKSDDPLSKTVSIETYARKQGLTAREVRRQLGTGKLPFVQIRGRIRLQLPADSGS